MTSSQPSETAPRPSRRPDLLMLLVALATGCMLGGLGIASYMGYNSSMLDLGNMSQAIWSATQGQPLVFTYINGPTSRLSLHVEIIYFLLALPYALWPDPRLLLIIQAALFVAGALPAYRLALRTTGSVFAARCIALIYLFYPVAQTAVLFDLHGDTLAMPLLMFALEALDRQAWYVYALTITLAVLCKFYVALPIAILGLLIGWQHRQWHVGLSTTVAAVLYGAFAFFIIRPLFTTAATSEAHRGITYLLFYFGQFARIADSSPGRLLNACIVFGPALFIAWRGWRWLLPGLPIAAAMLLSSGPGAVYGYNHHHYALIVPFIVMAVIDGTRCMQEAQPGTRRGRNWRGDLGLTLAIVLLCNMLLVDTPASWSFWLAPPGSGLDPSRYGIVARDDVKNQFLAAYVPPQVPLAASAHLATHLVNRPTLYLVRYPDGAGKEQFPVVLTKVDYVLADALFDVRFVEDGETINKINTELLQIEATLNQPNFGLIAARDGLLLFKRAAEPQQVLEQRVEQLPINARPGLRESFGDKIGLVRAELEQLGERRYRAMFEWYRDKQAPLAQTYVAISRWDGIEGARIVHLPTYVLYPTDRWQPWEIVRETFDVELPADIAPGVYPWRVGWYDVAHSEAYATDERSRLAGSQEVTLFSVEVH